MPVRKNYNLVATESWTPYVVVIGIILVVALYASHSIGLWELGDLDSKATQVYYGQ